jgi:hypothetical protein
VKLASEDHYGVDVGLLLVGAAAAPVKAAMQAAVRIPAGSRSEEPGSRRAGGHVFGGRADGHSAY